MKFINKYKSPNFDKRKKGLFLKYIIIHYTALDNNIDAINHLCNPKYKVSSHFLISKTGQIFYLVNLSLRAWHAGKSYWKGTSDINSQSIGIEIDNSGHHNKFERYSSKQINSLIKLLKYICKKFDIDQKNILGHSDVSPYRKIDPGEKFPWLKLYEKKISFLPKKISKGDFRKIETFLKNKSIRNSRKSRTLYMLTKIGYDVKFRKSLKHYKMLIKAYQMHYRQNAVTGNLDLETYKIIQSHYNEILT